MREFVILCDGEEFPEENVLALENAMQGFVQTDTPLCVEFIFVDGEEIRRLNESRVLIEHIYTCVVALVIPDDQLRIFVCFKTFQHACQCACAHLCSASGALSEFCQLHIGFHRCILMRFPPCRAAGIRRLHRRQFAQLPEAGLKDKLLRIVHKCRSCCSDLAERA